MNHDPVINPNRLDVVVGGQYGSEGKGHVAGALVDRYPYDRLIRVAGPNAGHTTLRKDTGEPIALRCIPAACIRDPHAELFLGAGSEIDIKVLHSEIDMLEAKGIKVRHRLWAHHGATVITERHHEMESGDRHGEHGSTRKGIGAARAERAMRKAPTVDDMQNEFKRYGVKLFDHIPAAGRTMIEGTQGYWLGLHAGHYPHCTSSDCRAIDFVAMAGTLAWDAATVYVLFRSFPIRIAGPSGGLRNELSWEELGDRTDGYVRPERTTVTKLIRRVGEFDRSLVGPAVAGNRLGRSSVVRPVLMFADYWDPALAGLNSPSYDMAALPYPVQQKMAEGFQEHMPSVAYAGTGPDTGVWFE